MASVRKNKKSWGGFRKGAGHPKTGVTKKKICISVQKKNWDIALSIWQKKQSRLVDDLVTAYVATGGSILEMRATI